MNNKRVAFVLSCFAVAAVGFWAFTALGKRQPQAESDNPEAVLAKARAAGLPFTQKELLRFMQVKPEDNAVPLFRQAIAIDEKQKSLSRSEMARKLQGSATDLNEIRVLLSRKEPVLRFVREASSKRVLDWGGDWDERTWHSGTNLSVRNVILLLCVKANLAARDSDYDTAIRELKCASRLINILCKDPSFISMLIGVAAKKFYLAFVERIVELAASHPSALERLDKEVLSLNLELDILNLLRAESYFHVSTIRNAKLYGGLEAFADPNQDFSGIKRDPSLLRRDGFPTDPGDKAAMVECLKFWTESMRLARENVGNEPRTFAQMHRLAEAIAEGKTPAKRTFSYLLSPYAGAANATASCRAGESCLRALGKILLYRQKYGQFPHTLKEGGFSEHDPFGGKELIYWVRSSTVKIYSVGPNQVDDLGIPPRADYAGDIVVSFPAPKR